MSICESCGVDKKHHANGLCRTCYDREFTRTRIRKYTICIVCGEYKEHIAHGMCRKCYGKHHYNTYARPSNKIICKICKQEKELGSHGACSACYKKLLRGTVTLDGIKTFNTNCATYLGCDVAERVLSNVFSDVEMMPPGNPGYDFICNRGKKIDVKSACSRRNGKSWMFSINKNKCADYFLCVAFDNRENLNPLYLWLIPCDVINNNVSKSISNSTLSQWDIYKLDITKTLECCNSLKTSNILEQ